MVGFMVGLVRSRAQQNRPMVAGEPEALATALGATPVKDHFTVRSDQHPAVVTGSEEQRFRDGALNFWLVIDAGRERGGFVRWAAHQTGSRCCLASKLPSPL